MTYVGKVGELVLQELLVLYTQKVTNRPMEYDFVHASLMLPI
jgi:hypothetical protein